MKLFTILQTLCLFLAISNTAFSEDRRYDKSSLKVMTFNAEFLWDGVEPEEGVDQVNFPWKHDPTAAAQHMSRIAEIIRWNNPDMIQLTEVENEHALSMLNTRFLSGFGYRPFFIKGRDNTTGQDVALLTRIDPEGGRLYRWDKKGRSGQVEKNASKNFYGKFEINGKKIALIALHFLSRPTDSSRKHKRQAQADSIAMLAKKMFEEGYLPIVLGDFNDYDGEVGSRDHVDNEPETNVLKRIKELSPSSNEDDLFNVSSLVPKQYRYTAFYDRNGNNWIDAHSDFTSIDHILVHESLRDFVASAVIPHDHDPRKVSDHFPVWVRFEFSDQEPLANELLTDRGVGANVILEGDAILPDGTAMDDLFSGLNAADPIAIKALGDFKAAPITNSTSRANNDDELSALKGEIREIKEQLSRIEELLKVERN